MGLAIDLKLAGYTAATLPCYLAASNLQMQHSADSSYSSAFAVVKLKLISSDSSGSFSSSTVPSEITTIAYIAISA